ncbi:MAG: transglutaminase-like domain-containing protein, partial [Luteibaculum sp.]
EIVQQVRQEILAIGDIAIPELEQFWEDNSFEPNFRERVEELIHEIQFNTVKNGLEKWSKNPKSLLEGCYWVNRFQYPDLEIGTLKDGIKELAGLANPNGFWGYGPKTSIQEMNDILYRKRGFRGNKRHFHAPQNNFLSDVLSSKKGNPLLLSVLYILVAEELNIPIVGVNLPNHFIAGYKAWVQEDEEVILFYVNPFSKGSTLSKQDLVVFLQEMKIPVKEEYMAECSNLDMVKRMIVNLIYSYSRIGHGEKVEELRELEETLNK